MVSSKKKQVERFFSAVKLPLPPSLNKIYRTSRYGRIYKIDEGKAYDEEVKYLVGRPGFNPDDVVGAKVDIDVVFKNKKHPDLDNLLKVLLDSLQGCLYKNDRCINQLSIRSEIGPDAGVYVFCESEVVKSG